MFDVRGRLDVEEVVRMWRSCSVTAVEARRRGPTSLHRLVMCRTGDR